MQGIDREKFIAVSTHYLWTGKFPSDNQESENGQGQENKGKTSAIEN